MKILVIGLDCAAPELLFGDERLVNLRRLMELGAWGRLESIIPPITVPAWMCMATSRDPGSLGVYGFRNRADHSYDALEIVNSTSIRAPAIWDYLAMQGGRSVLIGVPPSFPPRKVNGISVGCFMTPDTATGVFTHPAEASDEIRQLVGEYPVDAKGFRTDDKPWLRDEIQSMSRKHFQVVRHYLRNAEWDYFQFVEIGLDRIHHGFWKFHDPNHVQHQPGNPYEAVIRDYYRYLDEEIGSLLALLSDDTVVLVVSDHGAQPLDGGFCVNEWLIREGLLVLNHYPATVTPFSELDVDWSRTRVWSEGGYYARIFFNVQGREPSGVIAPGDYSAFRADVKARLQATTDADGRPLGTLVFEPESIYREVRNVAPDLIAHFGALSWRSVGGVGYQRIHVQENDTGPDDCNHSQYGAFILAAPNGTLRGEISGAHLLDIAPTLLTLAGVEVPESMQGRPLSTDDATPTRPAISAAGEEIIRSRLSGLGYIS
ncbi:MAG TPA: alkaline phosphatase family protein [Longimicrobiales bacterium]|nr:alkaline phosphatase family protein [Longimicrobiales bacterium]